MKKSFKLLASLLCLVMFFSISFAFAEENEPGDTAVDVPQEIQTSDPLKIDTVGVYSGMATSYGKGYIPTVKNGRVTVILPLIGEAKNNVITVTPDIGTDGPFVYANYHFDVKKSGNVFLIKLDIPLKTDRMNGTYPIVFNIDFIGKYGDPISQDFTVYVNITDGKTEADMMEPITAPEIFVSGYTVTAIHPATQAPQTTEPAATTVPTATPDTAETTNPSETPATTETTAATTQPTETPTPEPTLDPSLVYGGETFKVSVTLRNIGTAAAKNVKLTYSGDPMAEAIEIFPAEDINTLLIGQIPAGGQRSVEFTMQASLTAMAGKHNIVLTLEYSDEQNAPYMLERSLPVDVYQPVEVEFDKIEIPGYIESGDSLMLPIGILNVGRASIYDVTCKLDVKGLRGASVYIAEIPAGTSGVGEMNVFAGTLDTETHYGYTTGKLTITYKDAQGEEYEYIVNISTEITEPLIEADADIIDEQPTKPQGTSQWMISVIVGVAIIAIAVAVAIVIRYYRMTKISK